MCSGDSPKAVPFRNLKLILYALCERLAETTPMNSSNAPRIRTVEASFTRWRGCQFRRSCTATTATQKPLAANFPRSYSQRRRDCSLLALASGRKNHPRRPPRARARTRAPAVTLYPAPTATENLHFSPARGVEGWNALRRSTDGFSNDFHRCT